ncbi:hypothetical protein LCGC14_1606960 [marine sediment metagenome]|uniref:Uncharacterized protein n=1 Tax=marine sediment metagenome TaxID=412755 RepID=A0A0F9IW31_9ZZZZ
MNVKIAAEGMRIVMYQLKCEKLVIQWYALISFNDMEDWFSSSRCCIPLSLVKLLRNGKEFIKERTTI